MSEKKYHKNKRHLRLAACIFNKLSQNVCLINTKKINMEYAHFDNLACQMWLHVVERPLILFRFLAIFIHYLRPFMWIVVSPPNFRWVFNLCILIYQTCQMWLQVMEFLLILLLFLRILHKIDEYSFLKFCITAKFSHIMCLINTHILLFLYARCNYKLW